MISLEGEAGIGKTAALQAFLDRHQGQVRIHSGACENFAVPEPLGPLRDIARESAGRFALSSSGSYANFESLFRLLCYGSGPAVLAIEDIHWADEATLDLLRFLARRVRSQPALVVVTSRSDQPGSETRLSQFWASVPRDAFEQIVLQPLSLPAVERLAGLADAARVHAVTGGNPFYLTEYLAGGGAAVPQRVQEATLARVIGLSPLARGALTCAAVFPTQIHEEILRDIANDPTHAGVEECVRSGMLRETHGGLRFRHELARLAVEQSIAPLRRRELHTQILSRLRRRNAARAAELLHHAERAEATDDIVTFAVEAAEEARTLGAHREATEHFGTALEWGEHLGEAARADLLEHKAEAAENSGQFTTAFRAIEAAIAIRRNAGDALQVGNALRIAAKIYWQNAQVELADERSRDALELLKSFPETWQYAMALAVQCLLDMVAGREDAAVAHGGMAMDLAVRLQRYDIHLYALTLVGVATCCVDLENGLRQLREGIEEAKLRGVADELPGLYLALTYVSAHARRYDGIDQALDEGVEACRARDRVAQEAFIVGARAMALLDRGRLRQAMAAAEPVVTGTYFAGIMRIPAMLAWARARLRLGLDDDGVLDEARKFMPDRPDLLRMVPIAITDVEAGWLGAPRPGASVRLRTACDDIVRAWTESWALGEALFWLKVVDQATEVSDRLRDTLAPHIRSFLAGDWRGAAEGWRTLGCPYEEAVALSVGDESAKREALAIFDRLGAGPAARRMRREMRSQGIRGVPSGPGSARRDHPAGLSRRQGEVLQLVAAGLTNPEIGEALGLSAKTVEHHLSAILAALDVPNRTQAAIVARERGWLGERAS